MRYIMIVLFMFALIGVQAQSDLDSTANYSQERIVEALQKGEIILFDQNPYDLGTIAKGTKKDLKLKFINIGKEPIVIDFFDLCVCSEMDYEEGMKIAVGEQVELPITFDSSHVEPGDNEVTVDFQLKNIDPRVDLPYFYTFTYQFEFSE